MSLANRIETQNRLIEDAAYKIVHEIERKAAFILACNPTNQFALVTLYDHDIRVLNFNNNFYIPPINAIEKILRKRDTIFDDLKVSQHIEEPRILNQLDVKVFLNGKKFHQFQEARDRKEQEKKDKEEAAKMRRETTLSIVKSAIMAFTAACLGAFACSYYLQYYG